MTGSLESGKPGYDLTVIIPTFREGENIAAIITAVHDILARAGIMGEILVVDDSSPDNTIPAVRTLEAAYPNLRLVVRASDPGLSQSVVEGFSLARAPVFLVMDADFSHPVELIPRFLGEIRKGADLVIGSRYMEGGGIEAWPLSRRLISSGATLLGRLLFPEITDPVSGFFAVKREVVAGAPLHPRGYKILMEVLGKGSWRQAKEVPFVFRDRKAGSSKLRAGTILDYLGQVLGIAAFALTRRHGEAWREMERILRFGLVGLSGIAVNMGLLWLLTTFAGVPDLASLAIAIELSIVNNFLWNEYWTFGGMEGHRLGDVRHRFVSFQAVSIGGALINWFLYLLLTRAGGVYWLLANLAAILVAFVWNYLVNRNLTWRKGAQPVESPS